jgi:hypothetical protein
MQGDDGQRDDDESREADSAIVQTGYLHQLGHAGRVVRVLLAWLLSAIGLLYSGWGVGLIALGPAAVLLAFAAGDPKSRGVVLLCSLPTAIGICLAIDSLVRVPSTLPVALAASVVATLITALLGAPRPPR